MSTIECVCISVNTVEHFALKYLLNLFVCVNNNKMIRFDLI